MDYLHHTPVASNDRYNRRYARFTALVLLATVAAAAAAYQGDGTFIDRGPFEAHNRYVLDLGPLDLTKNERWTFRLASLPERRIHHWSRHHINQ